MPRWHLAVCASILVGLGACVRPATIRMAVQKESAAIASFRVRHTTTGAIVAFEYMAATAASSDLVFFGEQHDDPETHFAEFALLELIGRMNPHVILSLEMFERDVQPILDSFLAGRISEVEFLAKSRPWERYATDYRALVMLARARGWPVLASNVPRSIASAVGRQGLRALDSLPGTTRALAARDLRCPRDAYYTRFAEQMAGHGPPPPAATGSAPQMSMTDRFYEAQCVKDETMGESIARALDAAGRGAVVIHFNGAFHSDYGQGTVERALRRAPYASHVVISAVPVADPLIELRPGDAERASFVVFTKKPGAP